MKTQERWLNTGRAAEALGVSPTTLRRWVSVGLLQEGRHYRRGRFARNSPWKWETVGIAAAIEKATALPARPATLHEGASDG